MDRVRVVFLSGGTLRPRAALALALLLAAATAGPSAAQTGNALLPHPRLGLYGGAGGTGFPFVRADGSVNQRAVAGGEAVARKVVLE